MHRSLPPAPSRRAASDILRPALPDDGRAAILAWAEHVAAGRIGRAPPPLPEARARLARSEALLCARSRGRW